MKIQGMKFKILDRELFPRFIEAYKAFYEETEHRQPPEAWAENFLAYTIAQMKNPDSLYLLATRGKKVLGFLIANPMPSIDGQVNTLINGVYVALEHRGSDIAIGFLDIFHKWCERKGIKSAFLYENTDTDIWSRKPHLGFKLYKKVLKMEV